MKKINIVKQKINYAQNIQDKINQVQEQVVLLKIKNVLKNLFQYRYQKNINIVQIIEEQIKIFANLLLIDKGKYIYK